MTDSQEAISDSTQTRSQSISTGLSLKPSPKSDESNNPIARSEPQELGKQEYEFANFHASYVGGYIQLADTKAGATFAVSSAVLAYFFTLDPFVKTIKSPELSITFIVILIMVVFLCFSAGSAFWTIAPRRTASGKGIVFWGDVASLRSGKCFANKLSRMKLDQLTNERLRHCYDLSRVCSQKYTWLRRSMLSGVFGLAAAFVAKLII
tara:strand:- start:86 stop:709 length:624 start_codon:yes stop_codon:yes gene_type:complete